MHLVAGTKLKNGQYLLNHVLDQQGIGWTYRANNTQLRQTVLIKTLNPTLRSHPHFTQICQDFVTRTRSMSRLNHPAVVTVLDIFIEEEMPFIALEYLQGISLNDWMNDRQRSEAEVIHFLKQMTQVLTYLQQHELPHANLKPRNILYNSDPKHPEKSALKLVGFAPSLRLVEMIAKRNPYSAPELSQGKVSPQSDLYSLSALLYYCLTQHPPVCGQAGDELFPLISLLKPGAQKLLRSGTQPKPIDRPSNADLWLSQLSKSRQAQTKAQTATQTPTQTPVNTQVQIPKTAVQHSESTIQEKNTHIQPPIATPHSKSTGQPNNPLAESSQKPTYIQDPTQLKAQNAQASTHLQNNPTQVQPPKPIQPIDLPHYRTQPITQFTEPTPAEPIATEPIDSSTQPARYIPAPQESDFIAPPRTRLRPQARPSDRSKLSRSPYFPRPKTLKIAAGLSIVLGILFGLVMRHHAIQRPGASLFHTGQSFPPREWKGTIDPDADASKDVFVEPGTRSEAKPLPPETQDSTQATTDATTENKFPSRSNNFDPNDAMVKSDPTPASEKIPDPNAAARSPKTPISPAPAVTPDLTPALDSLPDSEPTAAPKSP